MEGQGERQGPEAPGPGGKRAARLSVPEVQLMVSSLLRSWQRGQSKDEPASLASQLGAKHHITAGEQALDPKTL